MGRQRKCEERDLEKVIRLAMDYGALVASERTGLRQATILRILKERGLKSKVQGKTW